MDRSLRRPAADPSSVRTRGVSFQQVPPEIARPSRPIVPQTVGWYYPRPAALQPPVSTDHGPSMVRFNDAKSRSVGCVTGGVGVTGGTGEVRRVPIDPLPRTQT